MSLPFAMVSTGAIALPIVDVPSKSFVESYPKRRVISSPFILLGWQAGGPTRIIRTPFISVAGIRDSDKTLCISVEHVTGGYSASARIPNPFKGSAVGLRLPSTLFRKKGQITDGDVALLVRSSQDPRCTTADPILSSSWGALATTQNQSVLLNLASGSVARVRLEGNRRASSCSTLDKILPNSRMTRQRFNTICTVTLPTFCKPQSVYELIVDIGDGRTPPIQGSFRRTCPK